MTSSNKARRYLQHHKLHSTESNTSHHSTSQLLAVNSISLSSTTTTTTTMRKFKGKNQQQSSTTVPIPQICVNNNDEDENYNDDNDNDDGGGGVGGYGDDDNRHVTILNDFDQVLENELKRTTVSRTLSLKQKDSIEHIGIPISQQRSFSFALGSKSNLHKERYQEEEEEDDDDENDETINRLQSKTMKLQVNSKSSLSKETFSRLFQSLTFRSGHNLTSKTSATRRNSQNQQNPCLACQNQPTIEIIPKSKKRPSIFGVLVSKLNTSTNTSANTLKCCSVCKRPLSKSISNNDDNQPSSSSSKILHDHKQLCSLTKRRQSLPSLLHNLLEPPSSLSAATSSSSSSAQHRPSISTVLNHTVLDNVNHEQQQSSTLSQSSSSLTESYDSSEDHHNMNNNNNNNNNNINVGTNSSQQRQRINYDDSIQLTEKSGNKDENDNEIILDHGDLHDLYIMNSNESTIEHNTNQQFLHPPEEKTRSLLGNVFRGRRSNNLLDSNDSNIVSKQLSASVINLATSMGIHRRNSAISTIQESTLDQRKHAVSEENLLSIDNTYIYFNDINGQNLKEKLKYSTISENTTLREMLTKLFEKYHLSIETCNICLRSAPTLPLSLDQPVKHLLLDDLVVTGLETTNRLSAKTSIGKERTEKRNSIGSAILSLVSEIRIYLGRLTNRNSKSVSKRLSSHCMMLDNDETHDSKSMSQSQQPSRTNKSNRSSIFASSIFTRDTNELTERPESNLSFIRRKCDEWSAHGLPKLAQLQFSIDECDLMIDKEWQPFLNEQSRLTLSETIKLQQEAIYEMLSTEVSYIRQILTMTDIFMTSISILKSSQRDGIFNDIDMDKLFSNIQDVLNGNLLFWKEILLPMKNKLQQTGLPMNPSDLKNGFMKFDNYFKPYLQYVLDQKASAEYFKQKFSRDDLFQHLITWIEANFTNRLSFSDLTIKPLQRLTRYKLLLEAIQKKTQDNEQRNDLQEMIQKVATFVNRINSKLHNQEQEERVRQINDQIGPYENVSAPPELTSILQEYNRDSISNRLNLLDDMPLHIRGYRRQIIQQGPMKMKDSKNSQDVYCYLFSDMFLITKVGKRSGSTNSSLSTMSNDGQSNRGTSNISNKILKSPIRIDRIDVREYDRRGGSSSSSSNVEPNTASFVAIVFSEYNLIESAYLFQTNLSKQWIENIRRTKINFNSLMEESKIKYQTIHHPVSQSCCTVSTNTIHQSLPSLSLPLTESASLNITETNSLTDDARRLSKVESNVFKIVEQTRRNSRTDRKNFGRYFTADGTSTHETTPAISPIKQVLSSSTTIIKRMSWNNDQIIEKNDSSLITNSFRSVHSSSGVSSTGSFLFSTDEDSSITTTSSSIPSIVPSIKNDEFDGKSSASTVIETDDPLVHILSIPQSNSISEDLIRNNLEDKDNQQLLSQMSPSSTSTIISSNQAMIDSTVSINNELSSPESSLRRIPYPSVRKRNQVYYRSAPHQQACRRNKISNDNDSIDSQKSNDDSTTIQTNHSPIDRSSLASSGNESDYDNNQRIALKLPVNDLSKSDELTLKNDNTQKDKNEQSDINLTTSKETPQRPNKIMLINPTTTTFDHSAPTSFNSLRRDSITTRRLLDIRSHLLLNTTLDATEV